MTGGSAGMSQDTPQPQPQTGTPAGGQPPQKGNAASSSLQAGGKQLSQPGQQGNYMPTGVPQYDHSRMGDAAAQAVVRGGDLSMGGESPQDPAQQYRQSFVDASARSETEAGDVTFGGPPTAPPQTGADRTLAMLNRDPNAGYSAENLKKTTLPAGPGNRPNYDKMDYRDLGRMARADQASGDYPPGDVDLGQYRATLKHQADQEVYDKGGKPTYQPKYSALSADITANDKDPGIIDPRNIKNLDRGGPTPTNEGGMPELSPEETISPDAPAQKVKFRGK